MCFDDGAEDKPEGGGVGRCDVGRGAAAVDAADGPGCAGGRCHEGCEVELVDDALEDTPGCCGGCL